MMRRQVGQKCLAHPHLERRERGDQKRVSILLNTIRHVGPFRFNV
jgi:hypothetical protein